MIAAENAQSCTRVPAVGQVELGETRLVMRSPTVTGSAVVAQIVQCATWAVPLWSLHLRCGIMAFALSGALGPRRGGDPKRAVSDADGNMSSGPPSRRIGNVADFPYCPE